MAPTRKSTQSALATPKISEKKLAVVSNRSHTPMKTKSKTKTPKKKPVKNLPKSSKITRASNPLLIDDEQSSSDLGNHPNQNTGPGNEKKRTVNIPEVELASPPRVLNIRVIGKTPSPVAFVTNKDQTQALVVEERVIISFGDEQNVANGKDESYLLAENDDFWVVGVRSDDDDSEKVCGVISPSRTDVDTDKYTPLRDVVLEDLLEPDICANAGSEKINSQEFDLHLELTKDDECKQKFQAEITGDFPSSAGSFDVNARSENINSQEIELGLELTKEVQAEIMGDFPSSAGSFDDVGLNPELDITGEFPCSGTTIEDERKIIEELDIMTSFTESDM